MFIKAMVRSKQADFTHRPPAWAVSESSKFVWMDAGSMELDWYGMLPISGDVVVVEDDPALGPLMVDILGGIRAECILFTTGDDALAHVLESHGHCGLLITDHGLPGQLQGAELVKMFRAKWPKVPIILTSGYALEPETFPAGVVYLQKPWPIELLVKTVADLLQPGIPLFRS